MSARQPSQRSTLRTVGLPVLLIALFLGGCLFLGPRLNPVRPKQHLWLIEAGDVSRTFVTSATRITGRAPLSIRPHHLEFSSTNGPVQVIVTPFNLFGGADEIRQMEATTSGLRDGKIPTQTVAQAHAPSGTIPLHWWPYGNVRYVVYVKPDQKSEVTLKVHYAP